MIGGFLFLGGDSLSHFKAREFQCKCRRAECDAPEMDKAFLAKLEELRERWGRPLIVTSGVRCRWHNDQIKGAPMSFHMRGRAADLRVQNLNEARALHALAESIGFGGIEIGRGFIHVDNGPEREWKYV